MKGYLIPLVMVWALASCAHSPRMVDNRADYPAVWLDPANCGVHSTEPESRMLLADLSALSTRAYLSMAEEEGCSSAGSGKAMKACIDYLPTKRPWKVVGGNGERSRTGLAYRIYESPGDDHERPRLVFAFRGTQFWSRDWMTNLYLRRSVPPPQQREASAEIRAWIETHRPEWDLATGAGMEGEDIYVVGHSLGGAVAQYMAYTLPRITAVVFNPSPRTGYGSIDPARYRNPAVCQMRESYEILYTVAGGRVPLVTPNLHACGFVNQKRLSPPLLRSLASAHSMWAIADALACYTDEGNLSDRCSKIVARKHTATEGKACH